MALLKLENIVRGFQCKITEAGEFIVQDKADWNDLLDKMYDSVKHQQLMEMPYDFDKTTIIGVYLGTSKPTSAIEILSADYKKKNGVYVKISRNIVTEVNQKVGNTLTGSYSPYHLVRIPKKDCEFHFNYSDDPDLTVSDRKPAKKR